MNIYYIECQAYFYTQNTWWKRKKKKFDIFVIFWSSL